MSDRSQSVKSLSVILDVSLKVEALDTDPEAPNDPEHGSASPDRNFKDGSYTTYAMPVALASGGVLNQVQGNGINLQDLQWSSFGTLSFLMSP